MVETPDINVKKKGLKAGLDIGYNHLIAMVVGDLVDGKFVVFSEKLLGSELRHICQKICQAKPESEEMLCAIRERDNYINHVIDSLPWNELSVLAVEDLKDLKQREGLKYWPYSSVLERIGRLAEENGVLLVKVDPLHTSLRCPSCGFVCFENRDASSFFCVACGYKSHADLVAARNILLKCLDDSFYFKCSYSQHTSNGKYDSVIIYENYMEPGELLALLRAAREHSVRDWCMLLLGYKHALRAAEIAALRVSDVNLKDGLLHARRIQGSLETWQPLGRMPGQPLLDEFRALKWWLRLRAALAERRHDVSDALFLSQKGGHMTTVNVWHIFMKHARAAGIEGRSVHALKHSRIIHLLRAGASFLEVHRLSGHCSLASTIRYVRAVNEDEDTSVARADAKIFDHVRRVGIVRRDAMAAKAAARAEAVIFGSKSG